eukprot:6202052-Pleurochrysis_carterae.AAC.1
MREKVVPSTLRSISGVGMSLLKHTRCSARADVEDADWLRVEERAWVATLQVHVTQLNEYIGPLALAWQHAALRDRLGVRVRRLLRVLRGRGAQSVRSCGDARAHGHLDLAPRQRMHFDMFGSCPPLAHSPLASAALCRLAR